MSKTLNDRRKEVKARKKKRIAKMVATLNPPRPVIDEQLMVVLGIRKKKE